MWRVGSSLCQVGCFFLAPVLSTCRTGASLPQDIWDRSPTTRDRTCVPRIARWTFSFKICLFAFIFGCAASLLLRTAFPVAERGGILLLRSTGCRPVGFRNRGPWALQSRLRSCVHWISCSAACGICLDPGLSPCTCFGRQILHHQLGSPKAVVLEVKSQSSYRAGSLLEMHIFRSHPGPADPSLKLSGVRPSHQL